MYNVEELRRNQTKWNKPNTERQMAHDLIYIWNVTKKSDEWNRKLEEFYQWLGLEAWGGAG